LIYQQRFRWFRIGGFEKKTGRCTLHPGGKKAGASFPRLPCFLSSLASHHKGIVHFKGVDYPV
jgi:hypothetical protein